ncbi:MAG: iron-sulfur cluster insertion protein ErpA [Chloroflexi bacterium]|nr:iron-sulfur cluster insertion protein ErpA [Chloroflexota bacterium]
MINLTVSAVKQFKRLVVEQGRPELALRVFVSPGGCSGMSYGMAFDEAPQEGDLTVEQDGVKVWVDEMSVLYLKGSEIDFVDKLMGGGFTINNPNAARSCACGHSFDTGGDGESARPCS